MSRAISPSGRDAYVRFERDSIQWDVKNLLAEVRCPTLVMHPALSQYISVDNARGLAAGIADARLHLVDTASSLANHPDVLRVSGEFLFEQRLTAPRSRSSTSTVVVLFADIVNSTGLTEEWGDNVFRDRAHALTVRFGGDRESERADRRRQDAGRRRARHFSFPPTTPLAAARRCARAGDEAGLPLHLGLHTGDVIRDEGNVFGGAVNVAARVSALSAPSEILVSQTVRDLAAHVVGCHLRGPRRARPEGRDRLSPCLCRRRLRPAVRSRATRIRSGSHERAWKTRERSTGCSSRGLAPR